MGIGFGAMSIVHAGCDDVSIRGLQEWIAKQYIAVND
jgi:hypothetical protein